jgi:PAS domain S-box-containing protein
VRSDDGRSLLLGGPSGAALVELVEERRLAPVDDLDGCLGALRREGAHVPLVVIDPGWPQPLSAARELRSADATAALALAVPGDGLEAMRSRLAFLPELGTVTVVSVDEPPDVLARQLDAASRASRQRQRVRGALDAINRDLAGRRSEDGPRARTTAVSEHYLAALVHHAADSILSIGSDGRIVTINAAAARTFGLDPTAVEGARLRDLFAEDDPGGLLAILAAAEAGIEQADDDLAVRLRNGRHLLLSATAAAIRDDAGSLAGLVVIARDVTAERSAEQRLRALQQAESLATLASGVAHEFNNLLLQAQGWADLASDDPDDTDLVTTALEHIGQATRRASELARAMLAYGGRARFEPTHVRLGALVRELRPLLAASVPAKLRLVLDAEADPELWADPVQLRQVVLNLVVNAVEAIGDRPGTIHVRTSEAAGGPPTDHLGEHRPPWGRTAVVEVEDTGPGIDPELIDRLFDPFYTTKFTGRGLGLAAAQGIVRAHGGAITVDGRPGQGACFRVHLPCVDESS